jgi:pimeloyl-ACP methyl ester carboxylesterase
VLWGRDDAVVPVAYGEEFAGRIDGSRLKVLEDCGHAMQGDQPEQMWGVVAEFLG